MTPSPELRPVMSEAKKRLMSSTLVLCGVGPLRDTPEQAWDYYVTNGAEFESYVSAESVDENQRKYELVFKGR